MGFVPLTDCAPLVVAHEFGLFRKYGLHITLHRELGWATVRDKIVHRELDAAHALASMPVAATLGLGSIRCECLTGLVLSLQGNAITLSNSLLKEAVVDGPTLREAIQRLRHEKKFTFGVVAPYSSHKFLLRKWLLKAGIEPERDVNIVVVPPPQMVANIGAGHLDGFCVGEPWNAVAEQTQVGWNVATSTDLAPGHPEKVLMVRRDFAERRADEHVAMIAALLDACAICDEPEHQNDIVALLARREYVDVPANILRRGFTAIFHRNDANEPSADKAASVMQQMRDLATTVAPAAFNAGLARQIFRRNIFEEADKLRGSIPNPNQSAALIH